MRSPSNSRTGGNNCSRPSCIASRALTTALAHLANQVRDGDPLLQSKMSKKDRMKRAGVIKRLEADLGMIVCGLRAGCLIDTIALTEPECEVLAGLIQSNPSLSHSIVLYETVTSQTFVLHGPLVRQRLSNISSTSKAEGSAEQFPGYTGNRRYTECTGEVPVWVNVRTGQIISDTPQAVVNALSILRKSLCPSLVDPSHHPNALPTDISQAQPIHLPKTSDTPNFLRLPLVHSTRAEEMIPVTAWLLEYGVGFYVPPTETVSVVKSLAMGSSAGRTMGEGTGTAMDGKPLNLVRVWLRSPPPNGFLARGPSSGSAMDGISGNHGLMEQDRLVMSFSMPVGICRADDMDSTKEQDHPAKDAKHEATALDMDGMKTRLETLFRARLLASQTRDEAKPRMMEFEASRCPECNQKKEWRVEVEVSQVVLESVAL